MPKRQRKYIKAWRIIFKSNLWHNAVMVVKHHFLYVVLTTQWLMYVCCVTSILAVKRLLL